VVLWPIVETPAEIRAIAMCWVMPLGCRPFPRSCPVSGLKVKPGLTINNMAAGMSDEAISHEHTKAMAPIEKLLSWKVL
jgi:purine-nucleoside phosphorylase